MTPIEQWLADATRGLSAESAAQVRAEIEQHYDSACEAGDDAIAALGNPRAANRAYRKVLLTEREAMMAPALAEPGPLRLPRVLSAALPAAAAWLLPRKFHVPGLWPVAIVLCCGALLQVLFRPTTIGRTRIYGYAVAVREIVLVALVRWYGGGWDWALSFVAGLVAYDCFDLRYRLSILRKLAAGQTWSLLPEEPRLTHIEAILLRTLNQEPVRSEIVAGTVGVIMAVGMAVWAPATFAPMAIFWVAAHVTWRTIPFHTEQASRWFRIARWTAMAIAALLPVLYGARTPWIGAALLAWIFVLFDMRSISIRRKLPVEHWPKRLYW